MALTKQGEFTDKVTNLPDVPSPTFTPTQIKNTIQQPSEDLKVTMNNAFDKLNSTTDGDSGADNIGATGFDGTASTPQAMLEDLNTRKADTGTNWTGTWQGFSPSQVDQTIRDQVNTNTSQLADNTKRLYWKDLKQDYGAKGDGITNDTTALFNFFTGMANAVDSNFKGTTKFIIPAGNYLIDSIDLATIFGAHVYTGLHLEMDANARFIANTGVTGSLLNITPPDNGIFMYCKFLFGIMDGYGVAANGIRFRYVIDSYIFINRITGFQNNSAALFDMSGTPVNSFFNNQIVINSLDRNTGGNGLATLGNTTANQYGVQGNKFKIGQIYQNNNGVYNDVLGAQNSEWNTFDIGACEFNTNYGIIDNNGANIWRVGNTNSNTNGGFLLNTGAIGIPHVTGYFSDNVVLGGRARITNAQDNFGSIVTPSLPATGTDYTHQFSNASRIFITGGTVTSVKIDGVDIGLTSGMVMLYPGETINITYSVAPTWKWISI